MNSSFCQLIESMRVFTNILNFEEDYEDNRREQQIKEIVEIFHDIDATCLENAGWWTYIIEQSKDGIL